MTSMDDAFNYGARRARRALQCRLQPPSPLASLTNIACLTFAVSFAQYSDQTTLTRFALAPLRRRRQARQGRERQQTREEVHPLYPSLTPRNAGAPQCVMLWLHVFSVGREASTLTPRQSTVPRRLERNRESARKCRKKRKLFVGDLQVQNDTLGVTPHPRAAELRA